MSFPFTRQPDAMDCGPACLKMVAGHYGDATIVLDRSIVRAAVSVYLEEKGFTTGQVEQEMYDQLGCGFLRMPELVSALKEYTHHRDKYPTFNDFYPEIAKTLGAYVENGHRRINAALGK